MASSRPTTNGRTVSRRDRRRARPVAPILLVTLLGASLAAGLPLCDAARAAAGDGDPDPGVALVPGFTAELDAPSAGDGETSGNAAGGDASPSRRSVLPAVDGRTVGERERLALLGASAEPIAAADYRLGPGDGLELSLSGASEPPATLIVDAEGSVVLPGRAGRLEVAGMSLATARDAVGRALAREFRDQHFELTLTRLRRFKVFVTGVVAMPGTYVASATTRVSELVEAAGGVVPGGSERRILVDRVGGGRLEADLLGYARLGIRERNPFVDGGDIIRVPRAARFVSVLGAVAEPGRYELRDGETVADAVGLAGGLLPGALGERCEWRRLQDDALTAPRRVDLGDPAVAATPLEHGDVLVVQRPVALGRTPTAEVQGEVRYPGLYPITPGIDTVRELLERAGGYTDWSNAAAARLFRPVRTPYEDRARPVLVDSPQQGAQAIERQVVRLEERSWPHGLRIDGVPVDVEGDTATLDGAHVQVAHGAAATAVTLEPGDVLYVPRRAGRVVVEGRVREPGWVDWSAERRVHDYVELAGGYDEDADTSRLMVRHAGSPPGEVEVVDGDQRLGDGDVLWVPERGRVSWWRRLREGGAFLAQIATVVIIIDQAIGN
ncbi:MAG: SLBB domain-containing protein [Candidatus Eiseniibacteriota bacterium]